jgi:Protein of unknown function (DUF2934)
MSERAYRGPEPSEEQIRERAYEISQREDAGSSEENWERAKAELQAEDDKAA